MFQATPVSFTDVSKPYRGKSITAVSQHSSARAGTLSPQGYSAARGMELFDVVVRLRGVCDIMDDNVAARPNRLPRDVQDAVRGSDDDDDYGSSDDREELQEHGPYQLTRHIEVLEQDCWYPYDVMGMQSGTRVCLLYNTKTRVSEPFNPKKEWRRRLTGREAAILEERVQTVLKSEAATAGGAPLDAGASRRLRKEIEDAERFKWDSGDRVTWLTERRQRRAARSGDAQRWVFLLAAEDVNSTERSTLACQVAGGDVSRVARWSIIQTTCAGGRSSKTWISPDGRRFQSIADVKHHLKQLDCESTHSRASTPAAVIESVPIGEAKGSSGKKARGSSGKKAKGSSGKKARGSSRKKARGSSGCGSGSGAPNRHSDDDDDDNGDLGDEGDSLSEDEAQQHKAVGCGSKAAPMQSVRAAWCSEGAQGMLEKPRADPAGSAACAVCFRGGLAASAARAAGAAGAAGASSAASAAIYEDWPELELASPHERSTKAGKAQRRMCGATSAFCTLPRDGRGLVPSSRSPTGFMVGRNNAAKNRAMVNENGKLRHLGNFATPVALAYTETIDATRGRRWPQPLTAVQLSAAMTAEELEPVLSSCGERAVGNGAGHALPGLPELAASVARAAAAAEGLVLVPASNNRAGFKGVTKRYGKYQAQIKVSGTMRHLGSFATQEEAALCFARHLGAERAAAAATTARIEGPQPLTADETRAAAAAEGLELVPSSSNETSSRGVCKQGGKFEAEVRENRKKHYPGTLTTPEEAALSHAGAERAAAEATEARGEGPQPLPADEAMAAAADPGFEGGVTKKLGRPSLPLGPERRTLRGAAAGRPNLDSALLDLEPDSAAHDASRSEAMAGRRE
jgi:hypothetical protein